MSHDLIVIDELRYLPLSQSGGQLLFHLISKLYENTPVIIKTKIAFADWPQVFVHAKMTTNMLDSVTYHWDIVEDGNKSWRFKKSRLKNVPTRQPPRALRCATPRDSATRASPSVDCQTLS